MIIPFVHAETKTFHDCYSQTITGYTMMSLFTSNKINFSDPQAQNTVVNFCNFYHDKTGKWITSDDWKDIGIYGKEFYTEYHNTMPKSFSDLMANFGSLVR